MVIIVVDLNKSTINYINKFNQMMKKELFKKFLFLAAFMLSAGIYAQNVTGIVTSDDGPLPGATVLVKGTNSFATTDFDGNFTIEASQGDVLVVSFVGYTTQEVSVDGDQLTISLALGNLLEEVIVTTGYGTQSKRDITGAVTTVEADELLSVPATTFSQQLQGRAAGVTITNDATPGGEATVRIRGFGTIGNNDPLYVIDGVPTQSPGNINPNDIESLQILKDASAASIYGARAANGVVVITTKRGKVGSTQVSYNAYYGWQNVPNDLRSPAMNAAELGEYLYLADYYAGKTPSHGQYGFSGTPENPQISIPNYVFPSGANSVDESLYSLTPDNIYAITRSGDTNWWQELTGQAPITNHQIQASGANEKSQYAFTANYFSQDSPVVFVGYERATIRLNSSTKVLNDRLTLGENFSLSLDNRKGGYGNNREQNAVSGSYKHHPLLPVYDITGPGGNPYGGFSGSRGLNLGNNNNPYARLSRDQDDRSKRFRALGNVFAEARIADKVTAKTSFGFDVVGRRYLDIGRPQPEYIEGNFINGQTTGFQDQYQWNWTNTLNYKETFNDVHNVEALIGVEAVEAFGQSFAAGRQRFPFQTTGIISFLNAGNQGTSSNNGSAYLDFALWSQFAQVNYAFSEKYLVQVTVRNDASSRFKAATNSGVFPALSVGWRLSEEAFMSGATFIDDLKVRYGWGQTGNQEIGDYNAYTSYQSTSFNSSYPIDGNVTAATAGFNASQYGNPNAKWETTTSSNFGLDATMFDRKLNVEFDVFSRRTTDLLLNVPIAFGAGDGGSPALNIGEMLNTGFDFGLNLNGGSGDFSYSVGANISQYRNEIIQLDEFDTPIFGYRSRVPSISITEVGSPISMFYGFQNDGIFQTQAEADAHPAYGAYNAPGKFRVRDVNGDGQVNDDDRTQIGNPHPDFIYGVNMNFNYKNLALTIFGNGSQGNDVYNYVRYFADFNTFQGNRTVRALREAWQPSNPSAPRSQWVAADPNATSPIMDANDQVSSRTSTFLIEDGSYFRIKNIQLTYTFGDAIKDALGIGGGSIYVQGQNLITITNYTGMNPEIQTGADTTLGFDGGYMPVSQTILLGLNLNLF